MPEEPADEVTGEQKKTDAFVSAGSPKEVPSRALMALGGGLEGSIGALALAGVEPPPAPLALLPPEAEPRAEERRRQRNTTWWCPTRRRWRRGRWRTTVRRGRRQCRTAGCRATSDLRSTARAPRLSHAPPRRSLLPLLRNAGTVSDPQMAEVVFVVEPPGAREGAPAEPTANADVLRKLPQVWLLTMSCQFAEDLAAPADGLSKDGHRPRPRTAGAARAVPVR